MKSFCSLTLGFLLWIVVLSSNAHTPTGVVRALSCKWIKVDSRTAFVETTCFNELQQIVWTHRYAVDPALSVYEFHTEPTADGFLLVAFKTQSPRKDHDSTLLKFDQLGNLVYTVEYEGNMYFEKK